MTTGFSGLLPLYGWRSAPGVAPNVYLDDQALSLWLWDGGADYIMPVYALDAALDGGRYQSGAGSITVARSDPIVDLFVGSGSPGQEFAGCSLRAFYRDPTTPLWSGPLAGARMKSTGDAGTVEIDFEQFFGAFTGRRLISESAMGSVAYAAAFKAADDIARNMMARQIGPSGVVTPATYPIGVSREDFGPFDPDVAAEGAAQSSSQPALEEQSGTGLKEFIEGLAEGEDLACVCTDNLDQTFDLDVDYPFLENDLTDTIIFGQMYGNLVEFEATSDLASLGNVWSVEGAATGVHTYTSDSGSITVWGVIERRQQKPQNGAGNTPDTATAAGWLKTRYADGTISYKAKISETPGCLFNVDWFQRDKVSFDDAVHGFQFEQTCVEWHLRMTDGGPPELEFVFGMPPLDASRQTAAYVGARGRPNTWRNKRN